ncbi:CHC2 zinc finger domain-containing protein [Luteimonas sp. SDU82]|uniref:CHC2 zinc finger domain-containing protein n=1 Tax=Luteimonas sp. SDU82 TaxID=3422592 RepID=UPI003EBAB520
MSGQRRGRLPEDWRDRLPEPDAYYRKHIDKLGRPNSDGWAKGKCPFHEDGNASLSVHLTSPRGGWKCFAGCGQGDIVGFHMRRNGIDFREAAWVLLGWRG